MFYSCSFARDCSHVNTRKDTNVVLVFVILKKLLAVRCYLEIWDHHPSERQGKESKEFDMWLWEHRVSWSSENVLDRIPSVHCYTKDSVRPTLSHNDTPPVHSFVAF